MSTAVGDKTPAQMFALVFGVVYLVVGLVGFAVTGFDNFASEVPGEKLLVFAVNPLHNIAHLGVGALLLVGSSSHEKAKSVNLMVGIDYLLLAILGFAGVLVEDLLNVNQADNFLHIGTAALAIYFGTAGAAAMPGAARTA